MISLLYSKVFTRVKLRNFRINNIKFIPTLARSTVIASPSDAIYIFQKSHIQHENLPIFTKEMKNIFTSNLNIYFVNKYLCCKGCPY